MWLIKFSQRLMFFITLLCSLLSITCFTNSAWSDDSSRLVKVGVLLPLSGQYGDLGKILLSGIRLAAMDPQSDRLTMDLDIHDIDSEGAVQAAQHAISHDDKVIIGPLTRGQTVDVATVTTKKHIPLLSFTSDISQSSNNVWVIGLTPQEQVQQLVLQAQTEGRRNFAAFLPENGLGHAMGDSLVEMCKNQKLRAPIVVYHGPLNGDLTTSFADLSLPVDTSYVVTPVITDNEDNQPQQTKDEKKSQSASLSPIHSSTENQKEPSPVQNPLNQTDEQHDKTDALVLADTGRGLKHIAKALEQNHITAPNVRLLGPALWSSMDEQFDGVRSGWYATLDPRPRQDFVRSYMAYEHQIPNPLADLAYDVANTAKTIGVENNGKFPVSSLTRQNGFWGAEGHFVFYPDGRMHRDLSVYEIMGSGHLPDMVALSRDR